MSRRLLGALLGLAALSACADRDPLIPASAPAADIAAGERPALEVKFRAGFEVRLEQGGLVSASGARLDGVTALLDPAAGVETTPLFTPQAMALEALAGPAAARMGEAAPDLGSWYRVALPEGADVERFLAELRARPEVEHAYRAPAPAPPPGFVALFTTPDFSGQQGYVGAPPLGTDAAWARTLPGGDGAGVMVVDLEYDWHLGHEDLGLPASVQIGTGTRYTGFGNHHGTAVLGEIAGRVNGLGVTGAAPGATIRVIPPIYGGGYVPANAVAEAAAVMSPGDVLLVEQQAAGPTGVYVPLEVLQSVFDATRAATLAGRIVVAAAGNGGQNLDAPEMGGRFDRNIRDSGAIIVGAGSSLHARLSFSCYGSRVDVQGWGQGVTTTGYGTLFGTGPDDYYTAGFNGTSSASPIVASAVAAVQGRRKALGLPVLSSVAMRDLLRTTGTPQTGDLTQPIGTFPNLRQALAQTGAPGVPGGVAVSLRNATTIRVVWTAGADSLTHFEVARRALGADSSDWVTVASPGSAARRHDDTGLVTGNTYAHRVRACRDAACSDWAYGPAPVTVAPPAAPSGLTATAVSGTRLRLNWTDGSVNETRFGLERRHLDSGTWTPFRPRATVAPNVTVFADTGLVAGRAYRYRLNACNPAGCSAWIPSGPVVMPVAPIAPSGIRTYLVSRSSIGVAWADNSGNETHFDVIRRAHGPDGWGAWAPRGTTPPGRGSFADSAGPGTYQYRVRACNGPECSSWITSEVVAMPVPPATPTGPAAVALSATSIRLTWTDASSTETWFTVSRRMSSPGGGWQPWGAVARVSADGTVFLDEGVAPAQAYEYRVAACAGEVCSSWSPTVRVRLPAS